MSKYLVGINKDILVWARKRTGLEIDDVATAFGKSPEDIAGSAGAPTAKGSDSAPAIAARVREYLGTDLNTQKRCKNIDVAFKAWRVSVEDVGVFVFKGLVQAEGCMRLFALRCGVPRHPH